MSSKYDKLVQDWKDGALTGMLNNNWSRCYHNPSYFSWNDFWRTTLPAMYVNKPEPMRAMLEYYGIPPSMAHAINTQLSSYINDNGEKVVVISYSEAIRMGFKDVAEFYNLTGFAMPASTSTASNTTSLLVSTNTMDAATKVNDQDDAQADSANKRTTLNLDLIESNIAYATRVFAPEAETVASFSRENSELSFAKIAVPADLNDDMRRGKVA